MLAGDADQVKQALDEMTVSSSPGCPQTEVSLDRDAQLTVKEMVRIQRSPILGPAPSFRDVNLTFDLTSMMVRTFPDKCSTFNKARDPSAYLTRWSPFPSPSPSVRQSQPRVNGNWYHSTKPRRRRQAFPREHVHRYNTV